MSVQTLYDKDLISYLMTFAGGSSGVDFYTDILS